VCLQASHERGMTITDIKLLEKHGGKSDTYIAEK
jgi:molybdenum cofactor biosynthesis enzyme